MNHHLEVFCHLKSPFHRLHKTDLGSCNEQSEELEERVPNGEGLLNSNINLIQIGTVTKFLVGLARYALEFLSSERVTEVCYIACR